MNKIYWVFGLIALLTIFSGMIFGLKLLVWFGIGVFAAILIFTFNHNMVVEIWNADIQKLKSDISRIESLIKTIKSKI